MLPLHWEQHFHLLMFCGLHSFLFQNGPGGLTARHANLVLWFKAALRECCVGSMDADLASWEHCIGSMDDFGRPLVHSEILLGAAWVTLEALLFILRPSWVWMGLPEHHLGLPLGHFGLPSTFLRPLVYFGPSNRRKLCSHRTGSNIFTFCCSVDSIAFCFKIGQGAAKYGMPIWSFGSRRRFDIAVAAPWMLIWRLGSAVSARWMTWRAFSSF